jgi:hypothetical protein
MTQRGYVEYITKVQRLLDDDLSRASDLSITEAEPVSMSHLVIDFLTNKEPIENPILRFIGCTSARPLPNDFKTEVYKVMLGVIEGYTRPSTHPYWTILAEYLDIVRSQERFMMIKDIIMTSTHPHIHTPHMAEYKAISLILATLDAQQVNALFADS